MPRICLMKQKKETESAFSIWFLAIYARLSFVCVCERGEVLSNLRDFSIHPDLCFFLSFISSAAPRSPCLSVCLRLCVFAVCTQGWVETLARLITANGCYEISLHSSFVPVCPILLLLSPGKASPFHGSATALCLYASNWCNLYIRVYMLVWAIIKRDS